MLPNVIVALYIVFISDKTPQYIVDVQVLSSAPNGVKMAKIAVFALIFMYLCYISALYFALFNPIQLQNVTKNVTKFHLLQT